MKNKNNLKYISQQLSGSWHYVFIGVVFILVGAFFEFLSPKIIGIVVDSVMGDKLFDMPVFLVDYISSLGGRQFLLQNLYMIMAVFACVVVVLGICSAVQLYTSYMLSENLGFNMRQSIFEHLQRVSFTYHKNIQTGDIIQRCSSDIDMVRNFVIEMKDIVMVVAKIAIAYWFMFNISPELSIISFVTVPAISLFSIYFYSKIQKRFLAADEAEGELQALVQENLSAPRVVRAFGKQRYERDNFQKRNTEFSDMWIKVGDLLAWYWSVGDFMTVIQLVIVLTASTFYAVNGSITTGEVLSFMIFNGMLAWPVRSLGRIVGNMSKATVAVERINEIMNEPCENYLAGGDFSFEHEIEFCQVDFSFGEQKIFDKLSFKIEKGQTVAILGASGSGKSTILALLARFYDIDGGKITIDGVDIMQINLHSLRKQIGIVMQEPFLFSKTIKENIALTSKTIDEDRVVYAAKIAQVHDTITGFEKGYDTIVGEKGVTLSGGQKQRVAIARSLYSGSKILCFDDSLSAVDSMTDKAIRSQLKQNLSGVTTIIISQRVTTLMQADKILVLNHGKIAQQGSHFQLMQEGGIYSEVVKIQQDIIEKTKQEAGE